MYQSPFCPLLPIKWMLCKKALFFSTTCVCILCVCFIFFTHTKGQNPKPFFFLGVGGNIICKRDRWWVYWLLIVYTLLLSTLIYIFLKNVEFFYFKLFFPQVTKKSRKFYLVEMIFQIIYLFIWQTFFEVCYEGMFFKKN